MGFGDKYRLIRFANFCNFFTFCTGILCNLGIFEPEVAAAGMGRNMLRPYLDKYKLIICEKCGKCEKCGEGFCADFAFWDLLPSPFGEGWGLGEFVIAKVYLTPNRI